MNQLVREFLAANGYSESLKRFPEKERSEEIMNKFIKFKRISMNGQKMCEMPKLSFEINLDESDDPVRHFVVVVEKKKRVNLRKEVKKKERDTKKTIPKDFITHIVKLGFDAKDAARLYKSKDDWLGMSSGGKVLCTERGCKFSVPLSSDALFEHCRTVHGWRDYPCTHDNCQYVAYSKTSFKSHMSSFHSPYKKHNGNYHSCPRPGCRAAFSSNSKLIQHEKIHDNDLFRCLFCPYAGADQKPLRIHQRMHFNTRDFVCETCRKAFTYLGGLNRHLIRVHGIDEISTQCPLCDKVAGRHKIQDHLYHNHKVAGVKWDDEEKQYIVPEQV